MKKEYDTAAKLYDPLLYVFLNPIRKAVLNELGEYKEKAIVDLCCGTGNQLKILAENDFKSLHCLDISDSMLNIAKQSNFNINIYNEDATKTSFEDERFDIAIISFAIHEKDRDTQERFLEEAYRILKKDGMLLIVDYDYDKSTSKIVSGFITIIERIAGEEHYKNYRNYILNNGLLSLINNEKFQLVKKNRRSFNGVSISTYKKKATN
ncbi:MAG: class I SAM-dependent methyltransferase [Vulcanibacillus sp.]